jgi:hypothetical protein
MESSFVTNVHELAYAGFFAQECPTAELRIISKFFKASMVVYKAGNVSYNAVMMANTIITDFFVKYHKLFARGISLEFVDLVLTILFCYDGFWDILNRINVHLFYLTYRHQILTILSTRMATMYGAQIFRQIFDRLPLFNLGEDSLGTEERGNFRKAFLPFNCNEALSLIFEFNNIYFSFSSAILCRRWSDKYANAASDDERFVNSVKVINYHLALPKRYFFRQFQFFFSLFFFSDNRLQSL